MHTVTSGQEAAREVATQGSEDHREADQGGRGVWVQETGHRAEPEGPDVEAVTGQGSSWGTEDTGGHSGLLGGDPRLIESLLLKNDFLPHCDVTGSKDMGNTPVAIPGSGR